MMHIALPEHLARELEAIARRENRPVEEVVAAMIERYKTAHEQKTHPNSDVPARKND